MVSDMHAASDATRAITNDCWNRIGVRGNASCPELAQYVHCRNCPVFTAAAAEFLDSALPANYQAERTHHFSQERVTRDADTESVIVFRLGDEWLALPTQLFEEVAELRPIRSVPQRRGGSVLGLTNIRGELVICVSLDRVLGLERTSALKRDKGHVVQQRLAVLCREGHRFVFPIDEVAGTYHFHPRELMTLPATLAKTTIAYTKAILPWQEKSVGLLDDQLLFYTLNRSLA